jgi:hypothetical protein
MRVAAAGPGRLNGRSVSAAGNPGRPGIIGAIYAVRARIRPEWTRPAVVAAVAAAMLRPISPRINDGYQTRISRQVNVTAKLGRGTQSAVCLLLATLLSSCMGGDGSEPSDASGSGQSAGVPLDDNGDFDVPSSEGGSQADVQVEFSDLSPDLLCAVLLATTTTETLGMPVVGEPTSYADAGSTECGVQTEVILTSGDPRGGGSTSSPNEASFGAYMPGVLGGTAEDLKQRLLDGSDCPGGIDGADGAIGSYRWAEAWCADEIGTYYATRFMFASGFEVNYSVSRAQSLGEYTLSDFSADADAAFEALFSSIE